MTASEVTSLIETLLAAADIEKAAVAQLQALIWAAKTLDGRDPVPEYLRALAYDLDFYEPDDGKRGESASYISESEVRRLLSSALEDLKRPTHEGLT